MIEKELGEDMEAIEYCFGALARRADKRANVKQIFFIVKREKLTPGANPTKEISS